MTMMQTKRMAAKLAVVAATLGMVSAAGALSTSDRPASILVWPKVVVDSSGVFTGGVPVDTQITISNTNTSGIKQAYCFWVDATRHCANAPAVACQDSTDCVIGAVTGECQSGWSEIDFQLFLTQEQPVQFYAGEGLQRGEFPIEGPFFCNAPLQNVQCFNDAVCGGFGCNQGQSNLGSGIPPVPEDPFIGSLTCIQYTGNNPTTPDQSATRDRLIGEGAIVSGGVVIGAAPTAVDVAKYNAVGLTASGVANSDSTLTIGPGQEYSSCPSTLILSHIFDGATDPLGSNINQTYSTELTLVPCSNDFTSQNPGRTTAQFLVFNEFEQRFSTSRTIDCLFDGTLSSIDTRTAARSIFSAGVAGTIAGQTRIRGIGGNLVTDPNGVSRCVGGADAGETCVNGTTCESAVCSTTVTTNGGLLGVARAIVHNTPAGGDASAAYNLHQQGNPMAGLDLIVVP
jgi:hypothetical protein